MSNDDVPLCWTNPEDENITICGIHTESRTVVYCEVDCPKCLSIKAVDYWKEFKQIPMGSDDKIEKEWFPFPAGTDKKVIWEWFEDTFSIPVRDLLGTEKE